MESVPSNISKKELTFQNNEKEKRAAELAMANIELKFQNDEKEKRAAELDVANIELKFQNEEKEKRAAELAIANTELKFQNDEKEKRAAELDVANTELIFQNDEKEKRAAELAIANTELTFQNDEKEKRAAELAVANTELIFQNDEKEKRAAELAVANTELIFQNNEKEKRAAELAIANTELTFQNEEKEKRADELAVANTELIFQNNEKEKRVAELAIAREFRIAATVFDSQEGMLVTDNNNIILRVNEAFTSITGFNAEDAIGHNPKLMGSDRQDKEFFTEMWSIINSTGTWEGEIWNCRKNRDVYPAHLTITAVKDTDGIVTNFVSTFTDITARKATLEEIKNLAFYDPLTKLPNRRLLYERLGHALIISNRSGQRGSILFLDLDNFKTLNDTQGHDVGDLLLQQVAMRLSTCVREGDTVARIGGDEFVVLLEDLSMNAIEAATATRIIAEKIVTQLNQPYQLHETSYRSTASIGATLFKGHELSIDELLKQADIAMYQSKTKGRNTLRFFDQLMQEAINNRADIERDLSIALEQEQFQLHYQIQVDSDGMALGAEALIRWLHPQRNMIHPNQFISVAEECGLIIPIGHWVLNSACAQLKAWEKNPLTQNLSLSVNISAKQFHQVDFVDEIKAMVLQYAIKPNLLKLELTENILADNIEPLILNMGTLKDFGIQFELDDFGTGYSSLQYLKRLPLQQLKIDRSFVRDIAFDNSDRVIVKTIIAMADSLDLKVIAEGVETEVQRQFLESSGCMRYQGYLFSKPVPIDDFEVLLESL